MKKWMYVMMLIGLIFVLAACGNKDEAEKTEETPVDEPAVEETPAEEQAKEPSEETASEKLMVTLNNANEEEVGTAELEETDKGVKIKLDAKNLPAGTHGFHIHEEAKCEAPDFKSAGGHFNPTDASHGADHEKGPHAGDLPNLEVGEDGTVQEEFTAEKVTLKTGETNSLLAEGGTSLVIHEKADDGKSQPSGDAGDRIVCGVIGG
ncbi:Cu-Zn family superoxide dismutase [Bacillus ectoiniformans]|uniref:superoxide dismutase family protein n=1 Tax=Bacillus ectoiniformans TaxID=1494429 RepID=UPI00195AB763|nr:superoxide dismutase family protein [Bacillus ectoiniformans]MBM7648537.1 Cu-Zn family superoxide dismutase [Bacillus ectoiniformans]